MVILPDFKYTGPPPPIKSNSMSEHEFIEWLKGFVAGCHEYAPPPKQWDELKKKLSEVNKTYTGPQFQELYSNPWKDITPQWPSYPQAPLVPLSPGTPCDPVYPPIWHGIHHPITNQPLGASYTYGPTYAHVDDKTNTVTKYTTVIQRPMSNTSGPSTLKQRHC